MLELNLIASYLDIYYPTYYILLFLSEQRINDYSGDPL